MKVPDFVAGSKRLVRSLCGRLSSHEGADDMTSSKTDSTAPQVPNGWPPGDPPALIIVVGPKVAWVLVALALASTGLLATIAWRLDTLTAVVAVQRSGQ